MSELFPPDSCAYVKQDAAMTWDTAVYFRRGRDTAGDFRGGRVTAGGRLCSAHVQFKKDDFEDEY